MHHNTYKKLKLYRNLWMISAKDSCEEFTPDLCYTKDFISKINSFVFKKQISDYTNELFLYYFIKLQELKHGAKIINACSWSYNSKLTDKAVIYSFSSHINAKTNKCEVLFFYAQAILLSLFFISGSILFSLLLPFLLLLKSIFLCFTLHVSSFKKVTDVFFIRSKSSLSRSKHLIKENKNCIVVVDDIRDSVTKFHDSDTNSNSIYLQLVNINFPVLFVKTQWYVLRDIVLLFNDARQMISFWFALSVFSDYWLRIPHKGLYEACFTSIITRLPSETNYFSGDKEDRFALLQTRICSNRKLNLCCLPHGLEYGFKFPGGLCGNLFYCFSNKTRILLERLYQSKKFVYSGTIANKMLGIQNTKSAPSIKRTCYFSEPRDQYVNFEIIDFLLRNNVGLCLKLHPLETPQTYIDRYPEIVIIDELNDALDSDTCISRKSTILLEASHRGRHTLAAIINNKDRFYVEHLFPSLSSEKIIKAFSLEQLHQTIQSISTSNHNEPF